NARQLRFGERAGGPSARTARLLAGFQGAGIEAALDPGIRLALWEKFVLIGAESLTALLRLPLGPIFACAESQALYRGTLWEGERVGRAHGMEKLAGAAERLFAYLAANAAPSMRASQYFDLVAGRRLEVESLNGAAVRPGRAAGVPTPLNFAIYAALKPYADGAPRLP